MMQLTAWARAMRTPVWRPLSWLRLFISELYELYLFSSVLLSDFESLDEKDYEQNNQLAFDVAEREFGISPCMTGKEMSSVVEPDKLSMVMYLSQFYEMFKDTVPPGGKMVVLQFWSSSPVFAVLS